MIYFYFGLAALATFILNSITLGWFVANQNQNTVHQIINLWLKDPLEKVILVNQDLDCPQGTSEELVIHQYGGHNSQCQCQQIQDPQNNNGLRSLFNSPFQECRSQFCEVNQISVQIIDSIPSQKVKTYFIDQEKKKKLCTSRIEGYSFAKKAPLEKQCGEYEIYCSWKTNRNTEGFDIDHGYCIPNNRECFLEGVQLGDYSTRQLNQLPLVGLDVNFEESSYYNIIDYAKIQEVDLLKMNDIRFVAEQEDLIKENFYYFKTIHIPRVKVRCRSSLKDNLGNYYGNEGALNLSIAILIVSFFSGFLNLYFGISDIFHMCSKSQGLSYCDAKRINSKFPIYKNIMLILKPITTFILVIIQIMLIIKYVNMQIYLEQMIQEQCLDQYIIEAIGYNNFDYQAKCDTSLIYVALGLSCGCFIFDQNKKAIQQIELGQGFKETQTHGNENIILPQSNNHNNNVFNYPPIINHQKKKSLLYADTQDKKEPEDYIQQKFDGDQQLNSILFQDKQNTFTQNMKQLEDLQNYINNDDNNKNKKLDELRNKQDKLQKLLEKIKMEEEKIITNKMNQEIKSHDQNLIQFQYQQSIKAPEAPQPPEDSEKQSDSQIDF